MAEHMAEQMKPLCKQVSSIEIILTDGTKLVSRDGDNATDIYRWWGQCEEFAGQHGHSYPMNKHPLLVVEP